jgi:hypothetical protein
MGSTLSRKKYNDENRPMDERIEDESNSDGRLVKSVRINGIGCKCGRIKRQSAVDIEVVIVQRRGSLVVLFGPDESEAHNIRKTTERERQKGMSKRADRNLDGSNATKKDGITK